MGIKITGQKSLSDFENRLNKMKAGNLANRVAIALAEYGVEIARDEYNYTGINNVSIYYENNGYGNTTVIAERPGLNYIEFGTGITGRGSYPDDNKLPKETLVFRSRGAWQSTAGWEYNYYKEQNKKNNPDLKDWKGFDAMAQMYNTAFSLKNYYIKRVVREVLKGDKR